MQNIFVIVVNTCTILNVVHTNGCVALVSVLMKAYVVAADTFALIVMLGIRKAELEI